MSLQVSGKIKQIGEKQTFESGFQKVELVITTKDEKYPQDIKFDLTGEKVDDFLKYNKAGKDVDVSFNIRGNEYKGKHYVSLNAWKVFKSEGAATDIGVPTEELATTDLPF